MTARTTLIRRIKEAMAEPRTRGLDIDDPRTTALRQSVVAEKRFLRRIYDEWYEAIVGDVPVGSGAVLEIGSGAGFLSLRIPGLITSEMFVSPGVKVVLDCQSLPFANASLRAIVMTDVLHHVSDARRFLRDAARCVRRGGAIVMIEPWVTSWSRVVYRHFHHEPFEPRAREWEFPHRGPLSSANGALPWIILERDLDVFRRDFPEWHLKRKQLLMPFRYLLSGGLSQRSLVPAFTFGFWRAFEALLKPAMARLAMFAHIALERA